MALPKLYEQITWVNDTTPALNEDNLNAMSQALDDIDDRVIGLAGTIMEDVPQIIEDIAILEPAIESIDENVARAEAAAESAEQYAEEIAPPIEVVKDYAEIITLEDAINKPVKDLKVKVDAVQDLHGYTKPWVGGAGKNKLPNRAESKTVSGVTFTVYDDGTVRCQGKTNSGSGYSDLQLLETTGVSYVTIASLGLVAGQQYIISGAENGSNSTYRIIVVVKNSSHTTLGTYRSAGTTETFTMPNGAYEILARIDVLESTTDLDVIVKPMLRLASIADATFEPYTNICPISGHSEAKITRAGHNLLRVTATTTTDHGVTFTVNSDKTITLSGSADGMAAINVSTKVALPPNNYILSGNGATNVIWDALTLYNGETLVETINLSSVTSSEIPLNLASKTFDNVTLSVKRKNNGAVSGTISPMICLATDTNTEYEPYMGEVFTIDLDGTRYGGTLDVTSGVLTLDRAYVRKNTFDYKSSTSYNNVFRMGVLSNCRNGVAISDKFDQNVSASLQSIYAFYIGSAYGDGLEVYVGLTLESGINTLEKANTWLSNNGGYIDFVYPLATPQTINLTPEEVELLFGYNTLFADTGDLSLTYDASGVLRIANAKLDIDTFKSVVAASSDFADFKSRVAAL